MARSRSKRRKQKSRRRNKRKSKQKREDNKKSFCGLGPLPDSQTRYGSPYECLRKGVGVGIHSQREFREGVYVPPAERVFCGTKEDLPFDYTRFGNRYECLKKGVGAGMVVRNKRRNGSI